MKKKKSDRTEFEKGIKDFQEGIYVLHLYVTGATPNSKRATENIMKICEEYLKGKYELEIIDIYQQPHLAQQAQIIAAPTLIKVSPAPLRRLIGDLSDTEKVLTGLDLKQRSHD